MNRSAESDARSRNVLIMGSPTLWPIWPFLPLIRRHPGKPEEQGVLLDSRRLTDLCGLCCTVFLTNLFLLPPTLDAFLALPKETFDTPEEVCAAGWRVD
jgi:hypothetical protein